eukprot:CAMPEP_0185690504 /NCGR_PEP_ID=MMETSP1164-20130828/1159_1 /TAXON_ID=1104430 /ORGANISM="Chrysoreinhardia sp, Strain CCMP2950" /LENGTH=685 /DNA_ID=CAMNT_0028357075 /DNA_START=450 /DNA_END=2507 /DNA_ORIENTATION=-
MAISTEELNFLIYRYLQECGFVHSAFTFSYESLVIKSSIAASRAKDIPPGALVSFIQKGLLYLQVEKQLHDSDSVDRKDLDPEFVPQSCPHSNPLGLLEPSIWQALTQSQSLRFSKWSVKHDKNRDDDDHDDGDTRSPDARRTRHPCMGQVAPGPKDTSGAASEDKPCARLSASAPHSTAGLVNAAGTARMAEDVSPPQSQSMFPEPLPRRQDAQLLSWSAHSEPQISPSATSMQRPELHGQSTTPSLACHAMRCASDIRSIQCRRGDHDLILRDGMVTLHGHSAEVFCCAWHPKYEILASGSGDSTVRLWDLRTSGFSYKNKVAKPTSVALSGSWASDDDRDVTTLEWSADGHTLAAGCMDGVARLWTHEGKLRHSLAAHSESIFSIRFNSLGTMLLTGSYDKSVSVWEVASGVLRNKFQAHSAQVLDVDWKSGCPDDQQIFASCSTDRTIAVCTVPADLGNAATFHDTASSFTTERSGRTPGIAAAPHRSSPIRLFRGHADEVNAVRWDPSGSILASCSDDCTVHLWCLACDRPVSKFSDHREEIYTIRWSPTGPRTKYPNAPVCLASASFDATVRLWDADAERCLHVLQKHDKKVYTIAFSPDGELVASGSLGGQINVWGVKSGGLVKSFSLDGSHSKASTDIFEVAWNTSGTRLAATSTHAVTVIDVIKMAVAPDQSALSS